MRNCPICKSEDIFYYTNGIICHNCDNITGGNTNVERKPRRQICSVCHREYAVDFWVSSEIWELATHRSQREDLICLDCFVRMADTRFVEWDKDIKFFPVALITHIRKCKII